MKTIIVQEHVDGKLSETRHEISDGKDILVKADGSTKISTKKPKKATVPRKRPTNNELKEQLDRVEGIASSSLQELKELKQIIQFQQYQINQYQLQSHYMPQPIDNFNNNRPIRNVTPRPDQIEYIS
jgi:hypothetical protein